MRNVRFEVVNQNFLHMDKCAQALDNLIHLQEINLENIMRYYRLEWEVFHPTKDEKIDSIS